MSFCYRAIVSDIKIYNDNVVANGGQAAFPVKF